MLAHEKREHRTPKALGEQRLEHRRQRHEPSIGPDCPVGGEHVRVEVGQIAEGWGGPGRLSGGFDGEGRQFLVRRWNLWVILACRLWVFVALRNR